MLVHIGNLHAYTVFAKTEEDKSKWMAAIREALANTSPRVMGPNSSHEVVMHTFAQPATCDYCHRLLKGLFFQGYK